MKKLIVLIVCIIGLNVIAFDIPDKDIKEVMDIFGSIFKKTETKKVPESKPVDTQKVYISREQLEILLQDARDKGKKEGYKDCYRDGYRDGINQGEKNVRN